VATISRKNGFTLLELLIVIGICSLLAGLTFQAVQFARESSNRLACLNQIRQIALGSHNYMAAYQTLPPGTSYNGGGSPFPFMSFGLRLLPFLDNETLWNQAISSYSQEKDFLLNPPHSGARTRIPLFLCPLEKRSFSNDLELGNGFGLTSYLGVSGAASRSNWDGVLYLDSKIKTSDILDGTSNTLLVGERPPSANRDLGWWYGGWGQNRDGSGDSTLSVREKNYYPIAFNCPKGPFSYTIGKIDDQCSAFHFWSLHSGGANFAFCDGSARFLPYSADNLIPVMATRSGINEQN
jgi:prepilin-type N-terminal cleavage/methylation domain-containing protein/prepilin-type processing-associated H-X9-DG protein